MRQRLLVGAVATLLGVATASAQAPRFEIKGIYLGMSEQELTALFPAIHCRPSVGVEAPFWDSVCPIQSVAGDGKFTLGFSSATLTAAFRDGELVRAEVITDEAGAREASRALLEKYGNVSPFMASTFTLHGESCFVVRYLWKNEAAPGESLSSDVNFPACGGGGVKLHKDVSRRASMPDI